MRIIFLIMSMETTEVFFPEMEWLIIFHLVCDNRRNPVTESVKVKQKEEKERGGKSLNILKWHTCVGLIWNYHLILQLLHNCS